MARELARSISCRTERSIESETSFHTFDTYSPALTELHPQKLPYDLLHSIFSFAVFSLPSPTQRQHLCLTLALLSSQWQPVALRWLYSSHLTFRTKRFSRKKRPFTKFYKVVTTQQSLANAITWLRVDTRLVKDLTELLARCENLKHLGLERGALQLCHLHAASSTLHSLHLHDLQLESDAGWLFKLLPSHLLQLNDVPLLFPRLSHLLISRVWFSSPTAVSKLLNPSVLPALTNLTTAGLHTWDDTALRDALHSLTAPSPPPSSPSASIPRISTLTVLDPLRWTRHDLLRLAPSLQHLRLAELPKTPTSLRHVLPFLNASPFPLETLSLHASLIPKRAGVLDALGILTRGLILAVCERRTSLMELKRVTLSGRGWEGMNEAVLLLRNVCREKGVEFVRKCEDEEARVEWVEKAMEFVED